jgi:GNAT superfamily N-acetyltransferase
MTLSRPQAVVNIRPAAPEDAPGITLVFLESAGHHARLDRVRYRVPPIETILARYSAARQRPADAAGITLVAESRGEIVGFVDARCEPSPDLMHRDVRLCQVSEIAVTSSHRSRGIGARLLRAAEDWGRGQGAAFAVLEYHAANSRAGAFYQRRMGYSVAAFTAMKPL